MPTNPAYLGATYALTANFAATLYSIMGGSATLAGQPTTPVPLSGREVTIQNPSSNTVVLAVGSAGVSATVRGYDLNPGESRTYRSSLGEMIYLAAIWVFCPNTASQKVNIEVLQ